MFIYIVIWKGIVLTVIASSKHTKPQLVLQSIQGYGENKSDLVTPAQNPQQLLITIKQTGTPCLTGEGGSQGSDFCYTCGHCPHLADPMASFFLQDVWSFVLTARRQATLLPGLKSVNQASSREPLGTWWAHLDYSRDSLFS